MGRKVRIEEEFLWKNLLKYFLHGLSFSLIYSALAFVWIFILAILAVIGFIIGLIIGFVILFLIIGFLNSVLTYFIWSISVKAEWKDLLVHGFVLSLMFFIVHIPAYIISLYAPNLAIMIGLTFVYAFIDGFVAKNIAVRGWEEEEEEIETTQ
jgi:hypothetical protein